MFILDILFIQYISSIPLIIQQIHLCINLFFFSVTTYADNNFIIKLDTINYGTHMIQFTTQETYGIN